MKEIKLTQGKYALVDDENYDWLNQYKWRIQNNNTTYYARRNIFIQYLNKRKTIFIHREIMEKKLNRKLESNEQIDHINGDGLDNQEHNLRICVKQQNLFNSKKQKKYNKKKTISRYKGVCWRKDCKKWYTRIMFNGKSIYLGLFKNEKQAAKAYDQKAKELFGEFARLNFKE